MSDGCCYRVERPSVVVLTVLLPAKYLLHDSSLDLLVTKGHEQYEQKEITALPEYYLTMNTTSEQEGRGCARDMPPVSAAKPANAPARPAEAAVRAEAVCGRLVRPGAPGGRSPCSSIGFPLAHVIVRVRLGIYSMFLAPRGVARGQARRTSDRRKQAHQSKLSVTSHVRQRSFCRFWTN